MSIAYQIAVEHVRWAVCVDNRTIAQVMLEVGCPLPIREPRFDDAVAAVMQAWITLYCDEMTEAA